MINSDLAKLFYDVADVLEMQGIDWKPNAYRRAARGIESADPLEKLYAESGIKALKNIEGVGESIALKIEEYIKIGKISEFDKLLNSIPKSVQQMLQIQGLGPKKVMRLYKELKIKDITALETAIKEGKLQKLDGFGDKSAQEILKGLETVKKGSQRMLLGEVLPLARELCAKISKIPSVKRVEIAGSLRRMKETVGDIDILVSSSKPSEVMSALIKLEQVQRVLAKGGTKTSVILRNGVQADVRVLDDKIFGAGLQYFTGNKDHNIVLRKIAISKGYKLSEYGLFKGSKLVAGKTEEEIYEKLGLKCMPPEMREAQGEIEASHNLPKIIDYNEIKGDLHMHTKWSDGIHSIEDMARAAQELGYEYLAIADHSKAERIANGMDERRLDEYIKAIRKAQEKVKIKLFAGAEVSILADGKLDYADKDLKKLDIVIASVHSRFKQSREEMTKRILKALDNPFVRILGHPTGRLINVREPYDVDMDAIMEKAKKNNIALEVNANYPRLDLKDAHIRQAIEKGCLLAIDTDAHSTSQLKYIEFGIAQARRGWATAKNIVNSWSLKEFEKWIKH